MLVFILIVCIALIIVWYATSEHRGESPEERKERIQSERITLNCKHVCGLPLANGTDCKIEYLRNSIRITQTGNTFNLDIDKVTGITTTTNKEIQKHYVSNAGGAIGGALLFGPLGAIIGGMPSEKQSKVEKTYLVITYNSDDELKYISFEYGVLASTNVGKMQFKFNSRKNKSSSVIDL